jgi:hypothetical protein
MYQLAAVFLLMLGAWGAWRRNPTYSIRSTVRIFAVSALAISGAVLLIVATTRLIAHSTLVVAVSAMMAVIIFDSLALIFVIQAVCAPKESKPAALPASVKLLNIHRRKIRTWLEVFGTLVAVFTLGCLIPGAIRYISLTLGSVTVLLAVIMIPVLYVTSRSLDRALTQTELNPWVQWHYPLDQWQQWSAVQADRLRVTPPTFVLARDWRRLVLPFAIIIGGIAFLCPGTWFFKSLYIAAVCGAILAVAVLSRHGGNRAAEKLRVKLLAADPEVYFGRDGIFCDGVFTPWLNISTYLLSARIDERRPRSLLFSFEKSVPNLYGPSQVVPIHQSVLIPTNADVDADLVRLQRALTVRCPKAQIAIA